MTNENKMTKNLEDALKRLSKKPRLTRVDITKIDYNVPKYLVKEIMDDNQREQIQRTMGLNCSLVVGEYREDFKY